MDRERPRIVHWAGLFRYPCLPARRCKLPILDRTICYHYGAAVRAGWYRLDLIYDWHDA